MIASASNIMPFYLISDGTRLIIKHRDKDGFIVERAFLKRYDITCERYGLTTVNIGLHADGIIKIDHPLVMGVDIFDKLSVNDYLDIINEKIKRR